MSVVPIREPHHQAPLAQSPRLATWIATGLGAGLSPIAPGTAGTLAAIPPAYAFVFLFGSAPIAQVFVLLAVSALAVWAAGAAAPGFGLKDPGQIVVDEVAGYFVAVAFLPPSWLMLGLAFLLFRLFDIVKPPPCRRFEALSGGLGIVADDLMAGVYANLVLQILHVSGAVSL